jgi:hypothetical protein
MNKCKNNKKTFKLSNYFRGKCSFAFNLTLYHKLGKKQTTEMHFYSFSTWLTQDSERLINTRGVISLLSKVTIWYRSLNKQKAMMRCVFPRAPQLEPGHGCVRYSA